MDDEVAVRIRDGVAGLCEEFSALIGAQVVPVGVVRDGLAVHEFEGEVGEALLGDAAIVETRDAVVFEAGEDLPLGREAAGEDIAGGQQGARREQLERDRPRVEAIGTGGAVDDAHPAFAQALVDLPRPNALSSHAGVWEIFYGGVGLDAGEERLLQEAVGCRVRVEHRGDGRAEVGVLLCAFEPGGALGRRLIQCLVKESRESGVPVGGRHAASERVW